MQHQPATGSDKECRGANGTNGFEDTGKRAPVRGRSANVVHREDHRVATTHGVPVVCRSRLTLTAGAAFQWLAASPRKSSSIADFGGRFEATYTRFEATYTRFPDVLENLTLGLECSLEEAPARYENEFSWGDRIVARASGRRGEKAPRAIPCPTGSTLRTRRIRTMAIRVLLVDDHELVRQGIAAMLAKADDLQIVGEARTGREAVEYARRELPDVILMDVRMPDMDGLEATKKIKEERPRTAVVMLTMHENPAYLREAVRAGAAGYLLKDVSREELTDAIRQVASGGAFIESQMLKGMLSEMKPQGPVPAAARNLTKREREILSLVAEGMSNREIAERLVLSPETVKSHVAAILEKLGVSDRTQAAIYAVRNGLVEGMTT